MYVNDISSCLSHGTNLNTFADDTTLYSLLDQASNASLQRSLDELHAWGKRWKIKFEPSKSQTYTLSHQRKDTVTPQLSFGGTPLHQMNL